MRPVKLRRRTPLKPGCVAPEFLRSGGYDSGSFAGLIFYAVVTATIPRAELCGVANTARRIAPAGLSILRVSFGVRAWLWRCVFSTEDG